MVLRLGHLLDQYSVSSFHLSHIRFLSFLFSRFSNSKSQTHRLFSILSIFIKSFVAFQNFSKKSRGSTFPRFSFSFSDPNIFSDSFSFSKYEMTVEPRFKHLKNTNDTLVLEIEEQDKDTPFSSQVNLNLFLSLWALQSSSLPTLLLAQTPLLWTFSHPNHLLSRCSYNKYTFSLSRFLVSFQFQFCLSFFEKLTCFRVA